MALSKMMVTIIMTLSKVMLIIKTLSKVMVTIIMKLSKMTPRQQSLKWPSVKQHSVKMPPSKMPLIKMPLFIATLSKRRLNITSTV